jgi:hypothetical protein
MFALFAFGAAVAQNQKPVFRNDQFIVYPDKVVQGKFEAKALTPEQIQSNYESPANEFVNSRIDFKFSINGKDNEMISGKDHHFNCVSEDGACETPLIVFGEQLNDKQTSGVFLKPETKLQIRLDMRKVFRDFESKGFFESANGSRIYKNDFKGVYVAGGTSPMTWDFDNLQHFKNLELHDNDGDHIYEITLVMNSQSEKKSTNPEWRLSLDIKRYPQYRSSHVLTDALYNLSLEEMVRAVEKDSTLRTGKSWAGVWTRDVSYSIILSMAILQHKVAQYSLMRKVKDGVIIQDTGTGGAYPISTDRMIWAVAAWEIYKVHGERKWLETIYPIIKKSLEADLANAIDPNTGLAKGESSFLDWREQTYPDWMQPADIFESQCLGTNAVHYQANTILSLMAEALNDKATAEKHRLIAATINQGINKHLWIADKKYYGQFLYGRNFDILSPKSEALGEALCVLYDITDSKRQKEVVASVPLNGFGVPCIYPQIPNIPPYHNNAVWPFVQSYWALAAAKAGNENAVLHSIASITRPAALFLTNKENFVASSGDYASTQINSDNMLWSLSGNIAMIYKVLFGMQFETNGLVFKPFVPEILNGTRTLKNFTYRGATLDITMNGFGNSIKSITMDGKQLKGAQVAPSLQGRHDVTITLANNKIGGTINVLPEQVAPQTPVVISNGSSVSWNNIGDLHTYKVIANGKVVSTQRDTVYVFKEGDFHEVQVIAVDKLGYESFASEPLMITPDRNVLKLEAEKSASHLENKYQGFSGDGYVKTDINGHKTIHFKLAVAEGGTYAIDFRYANGNGPVNTENKCAIRALLVDDKRISTIVLPQRGKEEWSDWGYTNSVTTNLPSGDHKITLTYDGQYNVNMNGEINEAVIDYVRLVRID